MSKTALPEGLEQLGYGPSFSDEICGMLENSQMFGEFSRREIELLARFIHAFKARAGTTIFEEGRRGTFICLLVEGKLDIFKNSEGERRHLATVRPGKTVGEMSMVDEQPHSATVVAKDESILLLLTKKALQRIAEEHPRLGFSVVWKIAQQMSHRLRQTSGQLIDYLH